jgi:Terminase large subunit, T4likevirus-type, N-terminal/Terminase RNaseH-like domain
VAKSLETAIIKTPYRAMSMTEQQILEFARCADPVAGPGYFMSNCFFIQHPTRGAIQYIPYEYQERLIDSYHNYRFSISLMPRQTGKSTSAAGYLLWYAMFVPDSTILVAAHKYTGAQEIMQRIRYAYENCPDHIRAGVTSYNKGSLDFENGSRIVSATTTENTGRGMSISLLYADEFSFVRPTIAQEFWTSITPTLATGGKCIITSTPNSDEDQFAQIWKGANRTVDEYGNETELGVNGFRAFRSRWEEHPDRDQAWADQMQAQLGEDRFRREMNCEFIINDETLINPLHLVTMTGVDPIERQGQVRWYQKPKAGSTYVVSLDPSLGTGSDPAAIQVIELPSMQQVAEWQHNKTPVQQQVKILQAITQHIYDTIKTETAIYYSVENNSLGEAALVEIAHTGEEHIRGIFLSESARVGAGRQFRRGFTTTNRSKIAACSKLKSWIENGKLKISSKNLISELKTFVAHGTSFAAKPGETDDLVMSIILAIRMIQAVQEFDADLDETLRGQEEFVLPMPFIMM